MKLKIKKEEKERKEKEKITIKKFRYGTYTSAVDVIYQMNKILKRKKDEKEGNDEYIPVSLMKKRKRNYESDDKRKQMSQKYILMKKIMKKKLNLEITCHKIHLN